MQKQRVFRDFSEVVIIMLDSFPEDRLNVPGSLLGIELQIGKPFFPVLLQKTCVTVPKKEHLPAC